MKKNFKLGNVKETVSGAAKAPVTLVKKRFKKPEPSGRITTETIAEHRERVLAGGRRFKYPLQYARHRLVFNTIIIAVAVLIALTVLIWVQLYKAQNSSDFMYRITRLVPLPVASVDGQPVLYSDYLMRFRSSIHYKQEKEQISLKTEDGQRQADRIKREEMDNVIADAYASKVAKEQGITVSDSELQLFLKQQRTSPSGEVSESTYNAVILDYYGWGPDEYEHAMYNKLLLQKVAYAVDADAKKAADTVVAQVKAGNTNLKAVADSINKTKTIANFGNSGLVPKDNQDGGLSSAAAALKKGEVSAIVMPSTGDGYYIIKLLDTSESQVNYDYIHIPLTAFTSTLADLKKADKIHEYITIPTV